MSTRRETFAVDGPTRLDIRVATGEITVRTGNQHDGDHEVRITLEASNTDEFTIAQLGDTISIGHDSRWRIRSRSARVAIEAPPGTDVEIATATGEVRLTGPVGTARIKTASGDIWVDRAERLEVATASGSCRIGEVGHDTRLSAVSGDYSGRSVGGRFQASTASGDIRVGQVGGDVEAATTSGDIHIDRCDGSDITARSVSGDVSVGLPTGIRVDADLSTLSGRTTLPEPATAPSTDDHSRRPVRLRLRSVSGDIRVERAG